MISISVSLNKAVSSRLLEKLRTMPDRVNESINVGLMNIGLYGQGRAAGLAPRLTGTLARSITVDRGNKRVTVGTNLKYAKIHEKGGTIKPVRGRFLVFKGRDGKMVFARSVKIPKYKGRGYMKPTFDELASGKASEIMKIQITKLLH